MNSCTIGNMSIQAVLCVSTFSQTHAQEAATSDHYIGSDMTNSLCLLQMWQMPWAWLQQKNDDHGATTETPIAATATTAPGADENDDGPNEHEHEYVNIETDLKKILHPKRVMVMIWINNVKNNF